MSRGWRILDTRWMITLIFLTLKWGLAERHRGAGNGMLKKWEATESQPQTDNGTSGVNPAQPGIQRCCQQLASRLSVGLSEERPPRCLGKGTLWSTDTPAPHGLTLHCVHCGGCSTHHSSHCIYPSFTPHFRRTRLFDSLLFLTFHSFFNSAISACDTSQNSLYQ